MLSYSNGLEGLGFLKFAQFIKAVLSKLVYGVGLRVIRPYSDFALKLVNERSYVSLFNYVSIPSRLGLYSFLE